MAGTVVKRVHPPSKRHPKGLTRWRAQLEMGTDPITHQRLKRRQDFPTKREAHAALAEWQVEQAQGTLVAVSDQTVAELMDYWLTTHAATKKPRTEANYRDEVCRLVVPYLGSQAVQALQPQHIVAWHAALRRDGKSIHAIRLAHQRLQQALDQAAMFGIVPRNVAKVARPPQLERRPERPTWTEDQARAFLTVARQHCIYGPIFRLALVTGMRRGELLGLRWADVDWKEGMLHVRQSIGPVEHTMTTGTPKSRRAERDVAVTEGLLEDLREHRAKQNARRLALGPAWHDQDLVFCSEIGTPIGDSNLHREYRRLIALAGVPHITIHDQRHTVASWANARGVDPKTTAERLGQDVTMTLGRYTHTNQKQHRAAAEILEEIVSDAGEASNEGTDAL